MGRSGYDCGILEMARLSWISATPRWSRLGEYAGDLGLGGLSETDIRYTALGAARTQDSLLCDSALSRLSALTLLITNTYSQPSSVTRYTSILGSRVASSARSAKSFFLSTLWSTSFLAPSPPPSSAWTETSHRPALCSRPAAPQKPSGPLCLADTGPIPAGPREARRRQRRVLEQCASPGRLARGSRHTL